MTLLITDPVTTLIDPLTGDLPDGPLTEARGFDAAVQGARVRLGICAGEAFTNLDQGVRYRERPGVSAAVAILGQKFNRTKALTEFRANLLGDSSRGIVGVPGLTTLPTLDATFNHDNREMRVVWKGVTVFGDTPPDTLLAKV